MVLCLFFNRTLSPIAMGQSIERLSAAQSSTGIINKVAAANRSLQ